MPSSGLTPGAVVKLIVLLLIVRFAADWMATIPRSLLLTVLPVIVIVPAPNGRIPVACAPATVLILPSTRLLRMLPPAPPLYWMPLGVAVTVLGVKTYPRLMTLFVMVAVSDVPRRSTPPRW